MNWLLILLSIVVAVALFAGVYTGCRSRAAVIRRNYASSRQLDEQVLRNSGGFDDALQDEDTSFN